MHEHARRGTTRVRSWRWPLLMFGIRARRLRRHPRGLPGRAGAGAGPVSEQDLAVAVVVGLAGLYLMWKLAVHRMPRSTCRCDDCGAAGRRTVAATRPLATDGAWSLRPTAPGATDRAMVAVLAGLLGPRKRNYRRSWARVTGTLLECGPIA